MLAYSFVSPLLMLGLPNAIYYFLPREKIRKRGILIDNLTLLFLLSVFFSIFLASGGYKILALRFNNPELNITLKWLIPYPLYVMPASILGAVLLTQNKAVTLTVYNIVSSLLITGLTIAGTLITRTYAGPLVAQIYFPLLLLPLVIWLIFKNIPGSFVLPSRKSMTEMLKYSVPLGLAGMLGMIMLETNKIVVSAMCTPEEFANYVNGAIEIPLIGIITGSISTVILVDMTSFIHNGDKVGALELFKKASIKSAGILFPVMVFLLVAAKPFIVTLYSEKYLESVIPFCIYLFILPVRIVVYGSALMALGQSRVILFRSVFDLLVNTLLSVILVHFFGYLGAAVATMITLYLWTVPYNLYKIGQSFDVKPWKTLPFKDLGKILLLCIMVVPLSLAHLVVTDDAYFLKLLVAGFLYFPVIGVLLLKFQLLEIPLEIRKHIPVFIEKRVFKE